MPSITERLDLLKETIQRKDFLKGEGLSNEVNIRMFCYESKEEMAVRAFTERLSSENLSCNVHIVDLYETFLSICEDKRILDRIPKLEERHETIGKCGFRTNKYFNRRTIKNVFRFI